MALVRWRLIFPFLNETGIKPKLSSLEFSFYILDVILVAICGYWINDWFDRGIDRINQPERVLAKQSISDKAFWSLFIFAIVGSIAITVILAATTENLNKVWILPLSLGLLLAYAWRINRAGWIGNVLVSLLVCSLPFLVYLSEMTALIEASTIDLTNYQLLVKFLIQFSVLVFLVNTAREILKDLADQKGDRIFQSRSLPLTIGVSNSLIMVQMLLITVIVFELLMTNFSVLSLNLFVSIMISALTAFNIAQVRMSAKTMNFSKASNSLKLLMLAGLVQLSLIWI